MGRWGIHKQDGIISWASDVFVTFTMDSATGRVLISVLLLTINDVIFQASQRAPCRRIAG